MEQHPVPRQITTFEFKLIGFMTLRQFIYLIVFIPLGLVVYFLIPIPVLNALFGFVIGSLGFFFAFFPINDRPLDVWIKNLFRRLTKPTQYLYLKNNPPIYYLNNLFFVSDPRIKTSHVESQEKLAAYLSQVNKKTSKPAQQDKQKQQITTLFSKPQTKTKPKQPPQTTPTVDQVKNNPNNGKKTAFFTGLVKNHKLIPLPGILIYVKDGNNHVLRLLKTNPHGVFATFNQLPDDEYVFEPKDPNNNYFFDTIKIRINPVNQKPFEIYSKELL